MLNWIIDFSLRHRVLVIAAALVFAALGVFSLDASGHRRLPGHHSGANSDQHRCSFALARGGRAANHLPGGAGDQRAAGLGHGAVHLQVRSVAGGRHVSGRDRHLLRPAGRQRATRHGGIARRNPAPADGAGFDGTWRSLPLRVDLRGVRLLQAAGRGAGQEAHRVADDSGLGGQAATPIHSRRGRSEQLGRLREAVPGPHRPRPAGQVRPDVRPGYGGRQGEQPQRRGREHHRGSADAAGPRPGPDGQPGANQEHRHHRQGRRADPRRRRGRRADRPRNPPRGRDGPRPRRGRARPGVHAHGREQPRSHLGVEEQAGRDPRYAAAGRDDPERLRPHGIGGPRDRHGAEEPV